MQVSLLKYTYRTGYQEIIGKHLSHRSAQAVLESYAFEYILNMDGAERFAADSKPADENSPEKRCVLTSALMGLDWLSPNRVHNYILKLPVGHYIVVDRHDHINKWSIWQRSTKKQKVRSMWHAYTEQVVPDVQKVFDLDLTCEYDIWNANPFIEPCHMKRHLSPLAKHFLPVLAKLQEFTPPTELKKAFPDVFSLWKHPPRTLVDSCIVPPNPFMESLETDNNSDQEEETEAGDWTNFIELKQPEVKDREITLSLPPHMINKKTDDDLLHELANAAASVGRQRADRLHLDILS